MLLFLFQHLVVNDIKQELRDVQLEENRKRELACALHVHFRDWLYGRDYLFSFCVFIDCSYYLLHKQSITIELVYVLTVYKAEYYLKTDKFIIET